MLKKEFIYKFCQIHKNNLATRKANVTSLTQIISKSLFTNVSNVELARVFKLRV